MKTRNLSKTTLILLTAAVQCLMLTGCFATRRKVFAVQPAPGITLKEGTTLQYIYSNPANSKYFRTVYEKSNDKKLTRNEIIDDLKGLIDQNYRNYEVTLRDDKNIRDLSFNLAAMGLTAAATVAGGEATKTILAAIATGVLGANATVDKVILKDFGIETIQFNMQKLRSEREKLIIDGKKKGVDDYTLNQALGDLVEYYNAGFVTRALASMVVDAGAAAKKAKDEADEKRK
jgi:hypothetical protein